MRIAFIAASIAVLSASVSAQEMLVRNGADEVRITQKACPANVLQVIAQEHRQHFRKALVLFQGSEYIACWALRGDGFVFLQYADGDAGILPMSSFSLVPDA